MSLEPCSLAQYRDAVDEIRTLHNGHTLRVHKQNGRQQELLHSAGGCILAKWEMRYDKFFVDRASLDKLAIIA